MKLNFNKKFKKTKLFKYGLFFSLTAVPVAVTACSGVSQELINKSYLVSNTGDAFTSNLSLSQIANNSLKTSNGFQGYLEAVVNEILYNWLVTLSQRNEEYKVLLNSEQENVNKEYSDLLQSYKNQYGSNWELKFQQEILDPSGGNKKNYIQNKLNTFARSILTDKLFSTLYLSVYNTKSASVDYNPTDDNILSALKNTANLNSSSSDYKFKFDNRVDLLSSYNKKPDEEFAAFQDFIFQKYAEYENPYIIDFAQWNYSTPSGSLGISGLYKTGDSNDTDASNEGESSETQNVSTNSLTNSSFYQKRNITFFDDTTASGSDSSSSSGDDGSEIPSSNAGSYIFPYFGNENATNTSEGTLSKFVNFLSESKTNDNTNKTNYITDEATGIKTIPVISSDNLSTLKFVKNSTLFTDESGELASAFAYIYGKNTNQITDINNSISHDIDLTSTTNNGLDLISANFINTSNPYSTSTSSSSQITTLQLSKSYLENVINKDGNLKRLLSNDVYVIDNFVPGKVKISDSSEYENSLNKFIFFRAQDGVYAASLDGDTLVAAGKDTKQKKLNSAFVVLYRYFLNKYSNQDFSIDLTTELSSFFNSNIDWLVYQFALLQTHEGIDGTKFNQTMFNLNTINSSQSDKNLANAISNYLPAAQYFSNSYSAAEKMYETKKGYNTNYGYSVYNNGLASNFNYQYATDNQAKYYSINNNFLYENALLASTSIDPFKTSGNSSVNSNINNTSTSLYKTMIDAITNVTNALVIQPAEYEKYSQCLYTTNIYVNSGLNNTLSDTNFVSNIVKKSVFEDYIGDFYSASNYGFNLKNNYFTNTNSEDKTSTSDLQNYLKNAMYNFFFMQNFQNETNSLFRYGSTSSTETSVASKDDALTSIRKYSTDLWEMQSESSYSLEIGNFNSLYSLISVVKYFMEDNFSNFLKYMRDFLGISKAFVVWQNSSNINLNTTDTTPTSQSLINQSIYTNINNSTYGSYYGKSFTNVGNSSTSSSSITTNSLTNNVFDNAFYQSSLNTNYFIATSNNTNNSGSGTNNNLGFMGLQTSQSNNLDSEVSDALFNKPYDNNIGLKGCLYGYGNNKETLKKTISDITNFSFLQVLAGNLDSLTNYNFCFSASIENNFLLLSDKKSKLISIVDTLPDDYFTKFDGYVGEAQTINNQQTINAYSNSDSSVTKYGTLAYQLNYEDFSSLASLQKALGAKDSDSYKFADEIICNLIVQFASQNSQTFLSKIVSKNRIEVYDIRAYNAFKENGIAWISNWKAVE